MNRTPAVSFFASLFLLAACAEAPPPEPVAPQPPEPPPAATTAEPEAPKPPEPSPEEKKKAEELKRTHDFHEQIEADAKKELDRWNPELHAEAKKLADKAYASGKAAIEAALKGKHRKPASAARDKDRHPVETLDFFGLKPTMTVLEYGPGDGWYTELLAPALAKKGKLVVAVNDPSGSPDVRSTQYGLMFKLFADKSPEAYGKIERVFLPADPKTAGSIGMENKLDMVILTRELHGMNNNGTLGKWLAELHKALKPKGILAIEQHRAAADAKPEVASKQGYLPEKWVIEQIEAAGFKLVKKSEINANPKDTKDYAEGVWTLPPSYRLKDKDHAKYEAIGESDRMTLKFEKKK